MKLRQAESALKFAEGYREMTEETKVKEGKLESLSSIAQHNSTNPHRSLISMKKAITHADEVQAAQRQKALENGGADEALNVLL